MDNQKVFSAIKSFVIEIKNNYGSNYKPLALYGRLLEKTEIENEVPVQKHISTFRKFVVTNREAILNKDETLFKIQKVKYNDNVFFNIAHVFKMAESESKSVLWEHLLVLSALLDKNSDAKNQLILDRQKTQAPPMNNMLAPMMSMMTNMLMGDMMGGGTSSSSGSGSSERQPNFPDMGKILSTLMNPEMLTKLTSTLSESFSDGKLDINHLLGSLGEVSKDLNIDLNIPKDANELKNGLDDVMGMFSGLGIPKEQMESMVETISTSLQTDDKGFSEAFKVVSENEPSEPSEPSEVSEVNEPSEVPPQSQLNLTDVSKDDDLEPGIQVCYIDGHCE